MNEFTNKQDDFNQKQYKKYLSCGYTGEMTVNEYGWCDNEVRTGDMETIDLFDKDRSRAYIRFAHLPNGKWIAASSLTMPNYGYGCPLCVWCDQYDTKEEAVEAELARIKNGIELKDMKTFITDAFKQCRDALRPLEIALF